MCIFYIKPGPILHFPTTSSKCRLLPSPEMVVRREITPTILAVVDLSVIYDPSLFLVPRSEIASHKTKVCCSRPPQPITASTGSTRRWQRRFCCLFRLSGQATTNSSLLLLLQLQGNREPRLLVLLFLPESHLHTHTSVCPSLISISLRLVVVSAGRYQHRRQPSTAVSPNPFISLSLNFSLTISRTQLVRNRCLARLSPSQF